MQKCDLKEMNTVQKGYYGEGLAKLKFRQYGFEVFNTEFNNKTLGFRVKRNNGYYDIKVRTRIGWEYIYFPKKVTPLRDNLFALYVLIKENKDPDFYLIPSIEWENPNTIFKSYDYKEEGLQSDPEWGINMSGKNLLRMEKYRFEKAVLNMI